MASLQDSCIKKVFLLYLILLIFITSSLISAHPRKGLLQFQDDGDENPPIIKKKPTPTPKISTKNQTKLIKPTSNSSKNQTKLTKPTSNSSKNQTKLIAKPTSNSSKNQTKLITKPTSNSSKNQTKPIKTTSLNSLTPPTKSQIKKINSTTKPTSKSSLLPKKPSDLPKLVKTIQEKGHSPPKSKKPSWIDLEDDDDDDLVAEFRGLPSKFQETIVPDLEKISKTSRIYLTKYNKEFTRNFKPYVGNKYASTIASLVSFAFIIIPLILVSLLFNRIKAYFSLQKILIFIQIYLAIYFTILCLSSLATGLEPLKFFYSSSLSTYICVQLLQTLAYVLYLLLLLMYLILVFSTETGLPTKLLGLGQTFVGFAVGLHYYMTVFHRAVLHQPPKSSWKVHGIYATCFLVICLLARLDSRKKAYLEEGGEEGKKS